MGFFAPVCAIALVTPDSIRVGIVNSELSIYKVISRFGEIPAGNTTTAYIFPEVSAFRAVFSLV